ncbi:hypothetical protein C8R46DRAFT_276420 [Mycena filopes]|nr:hypothetical protein C8R46DRAFT_276420 [Mycena filopes]
MSSRAETPGASESDRLIAALQGCFKELTQKQEEQGDRLCKAVVEALKPPDLATDKKTAFWNSYMKLADEYDKEFHQRYSTDLDTSLIFSGLFSAVASAFIIQIQPQLASAPPTIIVLVQGMMYASLFTTLLAALLAVLGKQWLMYYLSAGSRGTLEERGLHRQHKLDGLEKWKLETVLQMFPLLLHFGLLLFAAGMSVYLWTVHHTIAILVMALTAVGCCLYLFLLVSAMSSEDCPFQTPLAPLLTHLLSPLHFIATSIRYKVQHWYYYIRSSKHPLLPQWLLFPQPRHPSTGPPFSSRWPPSSFSRWHPLASPECSAVLWTLRASTDPVIVGVASEVGLNLQWPVKLGLNAVGPAIECLEDILRPVVGALLHPPSSTGYQEVIARKDICHRQAITSGRLCCSLRFTNIGAKKSLPDYWWPDPRGDGELKSTFRILANDLPGLLEDWDLLSEHNKWALHVMPQMQLKWSSGLDLVTPFLEQCLSTDVPHLDEQSFTDYVCCLCFLFGHPANAEILRQSDRRGALEFLMSQLLVALPSAASDALILRTLDTTVRLADQVVFDYDSQLVIHSRFRPDLIDTVFKFCTIIPRGTMWLDIVTLATQLIRDNVSSRMCWHLDPGPDVCIPQPHTPALKAQHLEWIYTGLEHVHRSWKAQVHDEPSSQWDPKTSGTIDGLLKLLAFCELGPGDPPIECLDVILAALSASSSLACSAFLILIHTTRSWLVHPQLLPTISQVDLTHHMGQVVLKFEGDSDSLFFHLLVTSYLELMQVLVTTQGFRATMFPGLSTWLHVFLKLDRDHMVPPLNKEITDFISVTRSLWVPEFDTGIVFSDSSQQCTAWTISAICNAWDTYFDILRPRKEFLPMARCTVSVALLQKGNMFTPMRKLPPAFSARLCKTLADAAVNARSTIPDIGSIDSNVGNAPEKHPVHEMAGFFETLAQRLANKFSHTQDQNEALSYGRQAELHSQLTAELDTLELRLQ